MIAIDITTITNQRRHDSNGYLRGNLWLLCLVVNCSSIMPCGCCASSSIAVPSCLSNPHPHARSPMYSFEFMHAWMHACMHGRCCCGGSRGARTTSTTMLLSSNQSEDLRLCRLGRFKKRSKVCLKKTKKYGTRAPAPYWKRISLTIYGCTGSKPSCRMLDLHMPQAMKYARMNFRDGATSSLVRQTMALLCWGSAKQTWG